MGKRLKFTKLALDALSLPDPGERAVVSDEKATGLQLRFTSNGVKTFSVFRRIKGGQPERVTLGRYPDMTIEQARRKAAEVNAAIEGGANPAAAKRAHKAELTFGDLVREYIERHAKLRKRTCGDDEQRFRQYLEKPLAAKKLSAITRQTIAAIHSAITRAGHPAVANRVLALVSSVYGRAVEWGLTETNPAKGIRRNPEKNRDRFLQSDEMPHFFAALAQEPNPTIRDYFLLSLLTGARRSNVLSMRWSEVNLADAVWRIPMTKNGTPQHVTLTPEAVQILAARKEAAEPREVFVFPGQGKTKHLAEPKKGWLRVLEQAGLSDLRIHDLRRTLGSWQAKTGASLAIIGKSLNHKSQQTTAIYARLDLDPVRQSVERATAAILAAAGVNKPAKVVKFNRAGKGKA